MGKYVRQLNNRMQITDKARYNREQYQSYMTGPEWRNVEMAEEYGAFLRDGKSMFQFPYFRQIAELWKVVYRSYSAARKYNSRQDILFSEYMMMDLFVGLFTTVELIPKGLLSLLLYPFLKKNNSSEMQSYLAEFYEKYATDLQTIPFYDHKYKEIRDDLTEKYRACDNHTWVDWFSWKAVSMELWARRWISKPLSSWFHQEDNLVPATTDILVKYRDKMSDSPEAAIQHFKSTLTDMSHEYAVSIVDDHVYAKDRKAGKDYTSIYARLTVPRYMAFQPTIRALGEEGILLRKIAGQNQVQVKCVIDAKDEDVMEARQEELNLTERVTSLYTYSDRIHSNRTICLFDVPVKDLHETLDRLEKQDDVKVKFIHNF